MPNLDARVKGGEWVRGMLTQVCGKTLGIIGTGAIGLRMAQLGKGIGMSVLAWSFHPNQAAAHSIGFRYPAGWAHCWRWPGCVRAGTPCPR